ncbi:MAG: hypothetical protein KBT29_12185 [Prevotellaceae bacterium]|nr:hypothetical protein [Candidatus Minthosoma caballi]
MRKVILTFFVAIVFVLYADAENPVILHPTSLGKNSEHHQLPRTPILMPEVFIDGNTLTFDATCIGSVICLVQDGAIVYSAIIGEDCTIILPDYLTGIFELQLQRGSIAFVGEIEL